MLKEMNPTFEHFVPEDEINDYPMDESSRAADNMNEQMLVKLLQNHPDIDETLGLTQGDEPRLQYIFQVPERYYEPTQRRSRSVDEKLMSKNEITNVLKKEKERMSSLNTDHDDDMLLVQNIGGGLLNELEHKLNKIRKKRDDDKREKMWER